MSSGPALSVVLPVRNGEAYLAEALDSVVRQTFSDFECLVIDDGSSDGSAILAGGFAARDRRIILIRGEQRGLVAALNHALQLARAPLVARMDADDVALPSRFALQVARFAGRPNLALVGGMTELIDENGRPLRPLSFPISARAVAKALERSCPFAHPAVVFRKSRVLAVGGYRPAMRHAEDYDLWLRLLDAGFELENIPALVLRYRVHEDSVTALHGDQQALATLAARLAHRARRSGLSDPFDAGAKVDAEMLHRFPEHLRRDADGELFAIRHARISLGSDAELDQAAADFSGLTAGVRHQAAIVPFCLRMAAGYLRRGRRKSAVTFLWRALRAHPGMAIAETGRRIASGIGERRRLRAASSA